MRLHSGMGTRRWGRTRPGGSHSREWDYSTGPRECQCGGLLGPISLNGGKVNAPKHKVLSHGHLEKIEAQLREEVQTLLPKAEATDRKERPNGSDVPAELARRETRWKILAVAKAEIEARAQAWFAAEQLEYEAMIARREAQRQSSRKPRGKEPQPPEAGPARRIRST